MKKNILLVLILIACVVAVSGCLQWLFPQVPPQPKETPIIHAVSTLVGDTYQITISSISNPTTAAAVRYVVKDATGAIVRSGYLFDIYSKEVDGVMFKDNNADGKISADDIFFIKSETAGGPGQAGGNFVLIYIVTNNMMMSMTL